MSKLVVGIFAPSEAPAVVHELLQDGLAKSEVSVISPGQGSRFGANLRQHLDGLHDVRLGDIGPALGAGPLVRSAENATGDRSALVHALVAEGIPEATADTFAESVRQGGTLVAAKVEDKSAGRALDLMNRHSTAEGSSTDLRVPIAQEELTVGKREVESGGVRVRAFVTEVPVTETIALRDESVTVERRPVDAPVRPGDRDLFRGQTFEVRATSEEAVVEKRARIVEEVVVRKDVGQHQETIRENLRRENVAIEQLSPTDVSSYRPHYEANFGKSGYSFDQVSPAYQYGRSLKSQHGQRGQWSTIEGDARNGWESKSPGTWEKFKAAVRHAFEG